MLSDGAQVLGEAVARYRSLIDRGLRSAERNTVRLLLAVQSNRGSVVRALWEVFTGRGVSSAVRDGAEQMVRSHAGSTRYREAFWLRQIAQRVLKGSAVGFYEHAEWAERRLESEMGMEEIDLLERGFMALHAMSYAVLRRLCAEPPSPVFGVDGTVRVGRVLTHDAELRGESSMRVLATGSSPYQVFKVERLWALGVARVPVRRVLTNVLLSEKFYYNESEHLLMGGQRWRLVFGRAMKGEMEPILKAMKFAEQNLVTLRIMHIWEEVDDEQVVPLLRQLWDEIRSAHER